MSFLKDLELRVSKECLDKAKKDAKRLKDELNLITLFQNGSLQGSEYSAAFRVLDELELFIVKALHFEYKSKTIEIAIQEGINSIKKQLNKL